MSVNTGGRLLMPLVVPMKLWPLLISRASDGLASVMMSGPTPPAVFPATIELFKVSVEK
jgi:hypothetical protein